MWAFCSSQIPPRATGSILIFFLSYSGYMEIFLAAWIYRRPLASFQLVFCENCPTHRRIFDVYVCGVAGEFGVCVYGGVDMNNVGIEGGCVGVYIYTHGWCV